MKFKLFLILIIWKLNLWAEIQQKEIFSKDTSPVINKNFYRIECTKNIGSDSLNLSNLKISQSGKNNNVELNSTQDSIKITTNGLNQKLTVKQTGNNNNIKINCK